jgi:hypothetical protein
MLKFYKTSESLLLGLFLSVVLPHAVRPGIYIASEKARVESRADQEKENRTI